MDVALLLEISKSAPQADPRHAVLVTLAFGLQAPSTLLFADAGPIRDHRIDIAVARAKGDSAPR